MTAYRKNNVLSLSKKFSVVIEAIEKSVKKREKAYRKVICTDIQDLQNVFMCIQFKMNLFIFLCVLVNQ